LQEYTIAKMNASKSELSAIAAVVVVAKHEPPAYIFRTRSQSGCGVVGRIKMAWTISDALADPAITLLERDDNRGIYRFRVGDLQTEVTVELCRSPTTDETRYELSHAIHTPTQLAPYIQGRTFWDYPAYALHQAVNSLTSYYNAALKAGHKPQEGWLKARNPSQF
jgi:hypothetical protein